MYKNMLKNISVLKSLKHNISSLYIFALKNRNQREFLHSFNVCLCKPVLKEHYVEIRSIFSQKAICFSIVSASGSIVLHVAATVSKPLT